MKTYCICSIIRGIRIVAYLCTYLWFSTVLSIVMSVRQIAFSATLSVRTPGVWPTRMPRFLHSSRSMWSNLQRKIYCFLCHCTLKMVLVSILKWSGSNSCVSNKPHPTLCVLTTLRLSPAAWMASLSITSLPCMIRTPETPRNEIK